MDYREAAALLAEQNDILILTHKRPDGDTIGCAVGLCAALRKLGKTAWVLPNADATSLFTPYLEGCLAPGEFAGACRNTGRSDARTEVRLPEKGGYGNGSRCAVHCGGDRGTPHRQDHPTG